MTRHCPTANLSPELLGAQERLLALRAAYAQSKAERSASTAESHNGRAAGRVENTAVLGIGPAIELLPSHLGWECAAVSKVLRRVYKRQGQDEILAYNPSPSSVGQDSILSIPANDDSQLGERGQDEILPYGCKREVNLHPAIGLGILRAKKAASGRIWLLLRGIDQAGQGWIEVDTARNLLTEQDAPLRVCGSRQFRNLLAQGETIFWDKRGSRLWLRSVPRVAAALGVRRLDGRPVALSLSILTQSIGKVRAHLYAAFHSGRKKANPISRAALAKISQVSPRTQQSYDRRAGVRKQRNFATGSKIKSDQAREQAWQKGPACFPWHDHQGNHGSTKATFLAWQLPNSYNGPHKQRPNGNRKRFNRQLADLSTKGMTGNDRMAVEFKATRYCDTAKAAAHSVEQSGDAVYWRGSRPGSWYVMDRNSEPK